MTNNIFSDIDGVVTLVQKGFYIDSNNKLCKVKMFSDADSAIIHKFGRSLTFISHDAQINKEWAQRHKVPFIHVQQGESKLYYILKNKSKKYQYIYIGDTLYDYECLFQAKIGYIPQDASTSLIRKIEYRPNIIIVPKNGGCGILDWVYCDLIEKGIL